MDRLGRRLADTADLQDQLAFHSVQLFTPSLGEITSMHVAVMGMMTQMALKDLGDKTRRGQLRRVLKGRVAGGLAYGYRVMAAADGGGGARQIEPGEAAIVERIFRAFAAGKSPEAIAKDLNREGVPGPGGRAWSNTTLRGQTQRGTGLLNNALYRGLLEWNRCSYVKDPRTGKRVACPNPLERWERQDVPELRIISDELWDAVKERQQAVTVQSRPNATSATGSANPENPLNAAHRPHFLLSGLMRCGMCAGGYTIIGKDRYGCATRRQKGACENARTITRQEIESRVLDGLKGPLLAPDLVAEFASALQEEVAAARSRAKREEASRSKKLAEIDRKIASMLKAIENGFYEPSMNNRIAALRAERDAVRASSESSGNAAALDVLAHPAQAQ